MATEGGVKEGFVYGYGPRYNNTLFRGTATVTGSLVVTLPLPIRFVLNVQAEINANTAPNAGHVVTVGNVGAGGNPANAFTLFVWQVTSSSVTTLIASTTPTTVYWMAWGSVTDNKTSGAY